MKIMLAAVAFSSEMSGVQRHAFNVTRCLLARAEISAAHLVIAPWQRTLVHQFELNKDPRLKIILATMERDTLSRNLWYARTLPDLAAQEQVDLVHLTYPVPLRRCAYLVPVVTTLHDMYPYEIPRNFGMRKFLFNRVILRQCLHQVDGIACVSHITEKRLSQYLPSMHTKAVGIYNCVTPSQKVSENPPIHRCADSPFLLCIAQHRRNKNIPLLLQIFAKLLAAHRIDRTAQLLIIGIPGPETPSIHRAIAQYRLQDRVILLDGLSEEELDWCYTHCEALVAPSSTEGFGLPIAEAMLAGCRIVCSDIPAFREVGGEHCRFVSLEKDAVAQFASAIVKSLASSKPVPLALPHLSIEELGQQYIAYYQQMISAYPATEKTHQKAIERLLG